MSLIFLNSLNTEIEIKDILNPQLIIFHGIASSPRPSETAWLLAMTWLFHKRNYSLSLLLSGLINNMLYFIDFSLGENVEDIESKGVDLHLLMEAFESTHPELMDEFKYIIEGYSENFELAGDVVKKIKEIIRRGRYTHD